MFDGTLQVWYVWNDFVQCMDYLSTSIIQAQDQGFGIIIGGDSNLSLGDNKRSDMIRETCALCNLSICNGDFDDHHDHRWIFRSTLGVRRRIDYIIASGVFNCISTRAVDTLQLGFDHRAVLAILTFQRPSEHRSRRTKPMRGWQTELDTKGKTYQYHEHVDAQICVDASETLTSLTQKVLVAGTISQKKDDPKTKRPERSPELLRLLRQRREVKELV